MVLLDDASLSSAAFELDCLDVPDCAFVLDVLFVDVVVVAVAALLDEEVLADDVTADVSCFDAVACVCVFAVALTAV